MSRVDYHLWLAGLSPGDEVALPAGFNSYSIHVVDRLTKTLIVLEGGMKYRVTNGRPVGEAYGRQLMRPTERIRQRIVDDKARARFARIADHAHREDVGAIHAMLAAYDGYAGDTEEE